MPMNVKHAVNILEEGSDTFQTVRQLDGNRFEIQTARLLEVSELGDFQAVEHHLPSDTPGAERRRLPIVFLKPDVVMTQVDTHGLETREVNLLDLGRRRLEDYLQLSMFEQPVRIRTVTAVSRTPRRLHVSDAPGSRTQHPQKGFRTHRSGADFEVVAERQDAALLSPKLVQAQDHLLEAQARWARHGARSSMDDSHKFQVRWPEATPTIRPLQREGVELPAACPRAFQPLLQRNGALPGIPQVCRRRPASDRAATGAGSQPAPGTPPGRARAPVHPGPGVRDGNFRTADLPIPDRRIRRLGRGLVHIPSSGRGSAEILPTAGA